MSKKPAKVASNEKVKQNLIGSPVLYIGNSSKHFNCPVCGRTFIKGFFYEEKGKSACSRTCLETLL